MSLNNSDSKNHISHLEPLLDWSKSVITINLIAVVGCSTVLDSVIKKGDEQLIVNLFCAILFFAVTIVISIVFRFIISYSVYKGITKMNFTSIILVSAQLISFLLGCFFFGCWMHGKYLNAL